MKKITVILFLVLNIIVITVPVFAFNVDVANVCFSPNGGCTEAIVKEINSAKSEIYVQAYSFTSAPIAKALVDAHKRGIKVEVILDKSQKGERYTEATFLTNAGIPTYMDAYTQLPIIRLW